MSIHHCNTHPLVKIITRVQEKVITNGPVMVIIKGTLAVNKEDLHLKSSSKVKGLARAVQHPSRKGRRTVAAQSQFVKTEK